MTEATLAAAFVTQARAYPALHAERERNGSSAELTAAALGLACELGRLLQQLRRQDATANRAAASTGLADSPLFAVDALMFSFVALTSDDNTALQPERLDELIASDGIRAWLAACGVDG